MVLTLALTLSLLGQPDAAARGAAVYEAQRCGTCHSVAGKGSQRSPLDGVGAKLNQDQLRKWVVAPREMDPKVRKRPYKLSPEDLDALVAWLSTLK